MKKFIFLLVFLFAFFSAASAQVRIFDTGKEKGSVPSYTRDGVLFVDAYAMTKKLGGETTFLAQSKQMRVKIHSFTAFITAGTKDILINGARAEMTAEAEVSGSKIYVPVELFTDKKLSDALARRIFFSDGRYELEDFFNIEYAGESGGNGSSSLFFKPQGKINFNARQTNRGVVEVTLEDSVLKRQGKTRVKDKLIENFTAKKCGRNQCLRFLMAPAAKDWKFEEKGGFLVFTALQLPGAEISAAPPEQISSAPEETVSPAENNDEDGGEVLSASDFFDSSKPVATLTPAAPRITAGASNFNIPPVSVPVRNGKTPMRIMIDPGHGGKDPGAVRRASSQEKSINLDIARELYDRLKKQGFDVRMTRGADEFLALNQRSKTANDFKADLFVSIHVNTAPRTSAQGLEVYFRSEKATDAQAAETAALENDSLQYEETHFDFADMLLRSLAVNEYINESSKLAGYVRNSVKSTAGTGIPIMPTSSIKQANFYVLKGVDAPAVLIECGYMSNPSDRKQLNNKAVRTKIADGIFRGILTYAKAEGWQ